MLKIDRTTINWEYLKNRHFPIWHDVASGPSLEMVDGLGSACFLDAPGYPSHFIFTRWDRTGNIERARLLIDANGQGYDVKGPHENETLRAAWLPLPLDSERVQIWIEHVYQHFAHCYNDPAVTEERARQQMIQWPVPYYNLPVHPRRKNYGYTGRYDKIEFEDLGEDVQAEIMAEYVEKVMSVKGHAWDVAQDLGNHAAVQWIRKFYPSYEPDIAMVVRPPSLFQEDWIYHFDHRPTDDECPGHLGVYHGKFDNCRMCGRLDVAVRPWHNVYR